MYGLASNNSPTFYFNTYGPILTSPVLIADTLWVISSDGTVYGIDPLASKQFEIKIKAQIKMGNWTIASPVVVGTTLYLGTVGG